MFGFLGTIFVVLLIICFITAIWKEATSIAIFFTLVTSGVNVGIALAVSASSYLIFFLIERLKGGST